MAVTAGKIFIEEVGSSTHYYAQYVSPRWARSMEKMKKIGLHIFYRTYGGGWSLGFSASRSPSPPARTKPDSPYAPTPTCRAVCRTRSSG